MGNSVPVHRLIAFVGLVGFVFVALVLGYRQDKRTELSLRGEIGFGEITCAEACINPGKCNTCGLLGQACFLKENPTSESNHGCFARGSIPSGYTTECCYNPVYSSIPSSNGSSVQPSATSGTSQTSLAYTTASSSYSWSYSTSEALSSVYSSTYTSGASSAGTTVASSVTSKVSSVVSSTPTPSSVVSSVPPQSSEKSSAQSSQTSYMCNTKKSCPDPGECHLLDEVFCLYERDKGPLVCYEEGTCIQKVYNCYGGHCWLRVETCNCLGSSSSWNPYSSQQSTTSEASVSSVVSSNQSTVQSSVLSRNDSSSLENSSVVSSAVSVSITSSVSSIGTSATSTFSFSVSSTTTIASSAVSSAISSESTIQSSSEESSEQSSDSTQQSTERSFSVALSPISSAPSSVQTSQSSIVQSSQQSSNQTTRRSRTSIAQSKVSQQSTIRMCQPGAWCPACDDVGINCCSACDIARCNECGQQNAGCYVEATDINNAQCFPDSQATDDWKFCCRTAVSIASIPQSTSSFADSIASLSSMASSDSSIILARSSTQSSVRSGCEACTQQVCSSCLTDQKGCYVHTETRGFRVCLTPSQATSKFQYCCGVESDDIDSPVIVAKDENIPLSSDSSSIRSSTAPLLQLRLEDSALLPAAVSSSSVEPVATFVAATAICGDGVVEGEEECDDANQDPFDGCNRYCEIVIISSSSEQRSSITPEAKSDINRQYTPPSHQRPRYVAGQSFTYAPPRAQPSTIAFPTSYVPATSPTPVPQPLASLIPLQQIPTLNETGPATMAIIGMGAATGWTWVRRRRK